MAASRIAAPTVPAELRRQSERITEQLSGLNKIIDTTCDSLDDMAKILKSYSPDLVSQFINLKTALSSYKGKAANIYGQMSESLSKYASSLDKNLDSLTSSVSSISKTIEAL